MYAIRLAFAIVLLPLCTLCSAKTVADTLMSARGDRLILSYEINQSGNQFTVKFNTPQKRLGSKNRERYKKLTEVIPMFFDRTGGYDNVTFEGITPVAFMKPSKVDYSTSEEGYFNLQDNPSISFSLRSEKEAVSIPIYLTHYEKKGRYNIFSYCGQLRIPLNRVAGRRGKQVETFTQTITSTSEVEADNQDITDALSTVERVMGLVAVADRLPFSENLTFEVMQLRGMRSKMTDASTLARINDALDAYDAKKQELEENAEADASAAQAKAEQEAKQAAQAEQAKADSIAAETQKQAENSQKRTIWMIVGGAILAVVCFVGNQVFQHFRNLSNQRSMQEMQDRMVKQAESEAKRRAQSYSHNKIHQAKNAAKNATRNSAKDALAGIKMKGKGSKNGPKTI